MLQPSPAKDGLLQLQDEAARQCQTQLVWYHDASAQLHLVAGQANDGGHPRPRGVCGCLHALPSQVDQLQPVLKAACMMSSCEAQS